MLGAKHVSVPNHLLGALPRKDYQKLLPVLEPVKLAFGEILYESHARIRHVYFPINCFVSMLTTVDAGRAAEVGLIGSEGMIGVPTLAHGSRFTPTPIDHEIEIVVDVEMLAAAIGNLLQNGF